MLVHPPASNIQSAESIPYPDRFRLVARSSTKACPSTLISESLRVLRSASVQELVNAIAGCVAMHSEEFNWNGDDAADRRILAECHRRITRVEGQQWSPSSSWQLCMNGVHRHFCCTGRQKSRGQFLVGSQEQHECCVDLGPEILDASRPPLGRGSVWWAAMAGFRV